LDVIDTIAKRMLRYDDLAASTGSASNVRSIASSPSCINHARFSAMSAHLAEVAAKASADALAQPASAHDPVPIEIVLRLLSDVRCIADVMAEFAAGNLE
jgi:hypothetical protein